MTCILQLFSLQLFVHRIDEMLQTKLCKNVTVFVNVYKILSGVSSLFLTVGTNAAALPFRVFENKSAPVVCRLEAFNVKRHVCIIISCQSELQYVT